MDRTGKFRDRRATCYITENKYAVINL